MQHLDLKALCEVISLILFLAQSMLYSSVRMTGRYRHVAAN